MSDVKTRAELLEEFVARTPFARFLGIQCEVRGDEMTAIMPFQEKLIGNVSLPALHGGAIGAFLEVTAMAQVFLKTQLVKPPKPIDLTIDYLRSGAAKDVYARATVTKLGRRVSSVRAEAWQEKRDRVIADLHAHFLVMEE